jgi:hypothetical protein
MKKSKIFLLFSLFSITSPLFSQSTWSIKAGTNYAKFKELRLYNSKQNGTFVPSLGFGYHYKPNKVISFRLGFDISPKGDNYFNRLPNSDMRRRTTLVLAYVESPILLVVATPNKKGPRLFINGGPGLGVCLFKFLNNTNENADQDFLTELEREKVNFLEISMHAGGGIQIPTKRSMLFLEGKYISGLTEARKESFNNVINFSLGAYFNINKN